MKVKTHFPFVVFQLLLRSRDILIFKKKLTFKNNHPSNKYQMNKILNDMCEIVSQNYEGIMKSRHLSVALQNNIPITKYKHNHRHTNVLGEERSSTHAEMDVIQSLLKGFQC
jgi:hypothetical protein